MPSIRTPLSSVLINGALRFATCWRIERVDGVIFRFTDHNTALEVDGQVYSPVGSFNASARQKQDGAEGANYTAKSYLDSTLITHDDLIAGKYKDAIVYEFTLVNWKYPWLGKLHEYVLKILEISFNGEIWEAKVEDLKSRLSRKVGRNLNKDCDYVFGDPDTCQVNLAVLTQTGTVTTGGTNGFVATIAVTPVDEYYTDGVLTWTAGDNLGLTSEIKQQVGNDYKLYVKPPYPIQIGDTFDITPGCAHTKEACKSFQGNLLNFGGFPEIPGNNELISTPNTA